MNIRAEIWTPVPDRDDGEVRFGEVEVEAVGDEEIVLHFKVDGEVVANALVDRFSAGVLVGALATCAAEAEVTTT